MHMTITKKHPTTWARTAALLLMLAMLLGLSATAFAEENTPER